MKFDPTISPDSAPFWRGAKEGKLLLPTCDSGHALRQWMPPLGVCPQCRSTDIGWRETEPRGTVVSWVVYRRAFAPEFPPPYTVALVRLLRAQTTIPVFVEPSDGVPIEVGSNVQIAFRRLAGDEFMPVGNVITRD
jgi:uncharacterized OB-fold protein